MWEVLELTAGTIKQAVSTTASLKAIAFAGSTIHTEKPAVLIFLLGTEGSGLVLAKTTSIVRIDSLCGGAITLMSGDSIIVNATHASSAMVTVLRTTFILLGSTKLTSKARRTDAVHGVFRGTSVGQIKIL